MNISSVIIKALEENLEATKENLAQIKGVEVALCENATIIATIEAEDTNEEIAIFREIERCEGVIAASMHYTYFGETLKNDIKNIRSDFLEMLNDDNLPLESMPYGGSVELRMKGKK